MLTQPVWLRHTQRYLARQKKIRKSWTKQQIQQEELRETFELYDLDGSGAIDVEELRAMVNELCIPMTDDELNDVRACHRCMFVCVWLTRSAVVLCADV